ncbi:MAG TPA: M23 family metallopeptidase [Candidatus Dormibacteraeota bacterium]|nr:M23 family metallopeptidase [Candidatus Dormibacteraeota bacterium]
MSGWGGLLLALLQLLFAAPPQAASHQAPPPPAAADEFQFPLSSWAPHCLGFGSQWRYCNGVPLRSCASGAVWLHTGTDEIASVGEPVAAAGDGVIVGYLIDPQFRGGVLIRHQMTTGTVITQYWHVWLAPGFAVGMPVKRGEVFANVADMGDKTHFHFAVFNGPLESHSWNGALPPSACSGFPAFPYKFIDPTAFIEAHLPPEHFARGITF